MAILFRLVCGTCGKLVRDHNGKYVHVHTDNSHPVFNVTSAVITESL